MKIKILKYKSQKWKQIKYKLSKWKFWHVNDKNGINLNFKGQNILSLRVLIIKLTKNIKKKKKYTIVNSSFLFNHW